MSLTIIDNNNIFQKDVIGKVRTAQEDSHDIAVSTPNGDVFVVCDGMGGHVGGKQASSIAVRSIIDYLQREKYAHPIQALNDALQFANMQILGYVNDHPELKGMGTTACIVLLQEKGAYIAHVGDSRIYLYLGKERELHRLTKDHSFVQTLVDSGQITEEQAEHHPNKNRILKALGVKPDLSPSLDTLNPINGDIFLICSDGLSGMITDREIQSILMRNTTIENKGDLLIGSALEAGGNDNITLELIRITNSPYRKRSFRSYSSLSPGKVKSTNIWKYAIMVIMLVFLVILCSLLVYMYAKNTMEYKQKTVMAEIVRIDGLIQETDGKIKKCESEKDSLGVLLTTLKTGYSNTTRIRLKQSYEGLIQIKKKEAEKLKQEMLVHNSRRDSLLQIYERDSMRLMKIKLGNK